MNPRIIAAIFIFFTAGCTSIPLEEARSTFCSLNLVRAEHVFKECKEVSKRDRLLCFMEGGLILYERDAYNESTEVLLKASQIIKEQDIVNISDQASAVMINDKTMVYKGEYCERLWVHTFLMMNFLMQNKYESALVEAKQALELFDRYSEAVKGDYFTRALIALCFENMNLPDDARIEYKKLSETMGEKYFMTESVAQGKGELVLFIGQGRVPSKVSSDIALPPSIRISIPRYRDSYSPLSVTIRSDHGMLTPMQITTDLGDVARKSLDERAAHYLSRQALRAGFKEYIAHKVGENNKFAEVLVRALLFLSEEADTRSWEKLPGSLTLVRITLDPGIHNLAVSTEYSQTAFLEGIDIHEGKRLYRSLLF